MRNSIRSSAFGSLVCVLALLSASPEALAEEAPYRALLAETSLGQALGGRAVPLLDVVPPVGGRAGQMSRLMSHLATSPDRRIHILNPGATASSSRSMIQFASDRSWYLEVAGDGSRYRYRGNIDDAQEIAGARAPGRLDLPTLERLGSDYVTQRLAPLLSLRVDDTFVFIGTRYLRQGDASEQNQTFTSEVIANIALFGREVRGTFVAGPGSKIAVWFSNSGEPVGFDVDWPEYQVSASSQGTLDIDAAWSRFSAYADSPVNQIRNNLSRFECGYVDLGVFKRGSAPIQAGCFAHHTGPLDADAVYASSEVIPIGDPVVSDPGWPVTEFIAAARPWDLCATSPAICSDPPAPDSREICSTQAIGEPGFRVTVPITVNNGEGVAGFQVDLSFDPAILQPVGVRLGADTAAAAGWTMTGALIGSGMFRMLGDSSPPTGLGPGPKELALVDFDIEPGAAPGATPLSQNNCVLSDSQGLGIPCDICPNPGGVLVRNASSFRFRPIASPVGVDAFDPLPFALSAEALDSLGNLAGGYSRVAGMSLAPGLCPPDTLQPDTLGFTSGVGGPASFTIACCPDQVTFPSTAFPLQVEAMDPPLLISGLSDPFTGVAKGDLDASGMVNVLDVTRATRLALSQAVPSPPPAEFQFWAGNILDDFCEVDSSINVLDVVRVRNKALGRPPLCPCSGPAPDTSASVWSPASSMSVSMVKEGLRSYLIMVQGAQDLSGLQLEFRGVAPKARVELIGLTAGQSWQAATEHADGHRLRAVAFSNTAAGISGDGAVLRLSGTGRPKLVNVIASDSQGREIPVP